MDENKLRTQVCDAARQLWMRGLVTGEGGMVTVEAHRRRYLATPTGRRRADLEPQDLAMIDQSGENLHGEGGLPERVWRPHRAAYRAGFGGELRTAAGPAALPPPQDAGGRAIRATVLCTPPHLEALLRLREMGDGTDADADGPVALPGVGTLLRLDPQDPVPAADLWRAPALIVCGHGVMTTGPTLAAAVNAAEAVAHAAMVALILEG